MNDESVAGVHWSYWVIGAVALIWYLMGAVNFFVQMNPDTLAGTILTMIHTLNNGIEFGAGEMIGIILLPLAVAAFLTWYAKQAASKGWIRPG